MRAQQVATAEYVLEESKEKLNRPPMLINISDDFRRHVEEVGGDPEHAVAGRAGRAPLAAPTLGMWLGLHQDHPHPVVRSRGGLAGGAKIHNDVAEDARGC